MAESHGITVQIYLFGQNWKLEATGAQKNLKDFDLNALELNKLNALNPKISKKQISKTQVFPMSKITTIISETLSQRSVPQLRQRSLTPDYHSEYDQKKGERKKEPYFWLKQRLNSLTNQSREEDKEKEMLKEQIKDLKKVHFFFNWKVKKSKISKLWN